MAYTDKTTGDLPVDKLITVTALVAPLVLASRLADPDDVINQTHLSGKQKGAYVLAVTAGTELAPTAYDLRSAVGSGVADEWVTVGAGSTVPAATTTTAGTVRQASAVANQEAVTVAGADVAALVTSTNTALATLTAQINALLAAERAAGQLAS